MSALDDFTTLIQETETIKQMIRSLKEEPAYLLGSICRQYEKTGRPVPDHQLNITGYLGEVSQSPSHRWVDITATRRQDFPLLL